MRLENAASWQRTLDKARHRRKPQPVTKEDSDGQVFMLKIFVGCEYECPRGHRFFMSSPDTILRGGSAGIVKDGGSKIVFNDMPLYFPCPCRNAKPSVAQLMRVHIVTPKAPVNIMLEPKVRFLQWIFQFSRDDISVNNLIKSISSRFERVIKIATHLQLV